MSLISPHPEYRHHILSPPSKRKTWINWHKFSDCGSWNTCPVRRCWGRWACSAWRRGSFWGDLAIHTRRLSRRQSQALHSGAWWVRQERTERTWKESFRQGIRTVFVAIRTVKQWSSLWCCAVSVLGVSQDSTWPHLEQPGLTSGLALLWARDWSRDLLRSLPAWIALSFWARTKLGAKPYLVFSLFFGTWL